jgi:hypothetical protein
MAAQIVEQDNVTRPERRRQDLFEIGAETLAIDGAVAHARCGDAAAAQAGANGRRPRAARAVLSEPACLTVGIWTIF